MREEQVLEGKKMKTKCRREGNRADVKTLLFSTFHSSFQAEEIIISSFSSNFSYLSLSTFVLIDISATGVGEEGND